MDTTRRNLLLSTVFGAGWLGLRALATGLPISVLTQSREAHADPPPPCAAKPQYLVLLTSGSGDPLNANVPGCYVDPGIYHPGQATMAPTPMQVGGKTVTAALPWTTLPANILARTSFIHHGTYTNSHGDAAKVNRYMGAIQRQEMLVSLIAKNLAPCMKTIQSQPVVLNNNLITYNGSVMPILNPPNLQAALATPTGPLAQLQQIRDTHLDQLNALFKQTGNIAQKRVLDSYALSQTEARSLSQQLLSDLSAIKGNTRNDTNIAAAVLFKMNVSPVAVATYSFGGDNHNDTALTNEANETVNSLTAIADLVTRLTAYGLQDSVTIALQNVFGRTLSIQNHSGNADGRNHNSNHHCSVLIGAGFKSSLIGGTALQTGGRDYRATGFDSATGKANDTGDVIYENTFGSVGKTLALACGVSQAEVDKQITLGKVIPAALA